MEENKIYDTSVVIEIVKSRSEIRVPYLSKITVVEYSPAIALARNIFYLFRY